MEGVYLRMDEDTDPTTTPSPPAATTAAAPLIYNTNRGKVVRPDFLQGITEQWTKKKLKKNTVIWT